MRKKYLTGHLREYSATALDFFFAQKDGKPVATCLVLPILF
jgi:hypothetical protein